MACKKPLLQPDCCSAALLGLVIIAAGLSEDDAAGLSEADAWDAWSYADVLPCNEAWIARLKAWSWIQNGQILIGIRIAQL